MSGITADLEIVEIL